MNALFSGCRYEIVDFFFHVFQWGINFNIITFWVSDKRFVIDEILFGMLNIDSFFSVNCSISFNDVSNFTSVLFDKLGCPISDITETLNCECLVLDAEITSSTFIDERLCVEKLSYCIVYTKTCWFSSSTDTSLSNMLASATSFSIDIIFSTNSLVGILNPSHDLFVCSHIWT